MGLFLEFCAHPRRCGAGARRLTQFCKTNPILLFHSKYLGLGRPRILCGGRLAGCLSAFFIDGIFAEYHRIVVRAGSRETAGIEFVDENGGAD
jgi:hypothetical protein